MQSDKLLRKEIKTKTFTCNCCRSHFLDIVQTKDHHHTSEKVVVDGEEISLINPKIDICGPWGNVYKCAECSEEYTLEGLLYCLS